LVAVGSTAAAAPIVTIQSPPQGPPLYDVQPTITISYQADESGSRGSVVNEDTLKILVNNVDWTDLFPLPGPNSVSWQVDQDHAFISGTVTITASVKDMNGATGSATATYSVFPTLNNLTPAEVRSNDTITIESARSRPDCQ